MIRFESLLDKKRRRAAFAEVTFAHAGELHGFGGVSRQPVRRPLGSAFSDPTVLFTSGGNLNARAAILVNDAQRPARLEFNDVAVVDDARTKRVDDYQVSFSQLKTRSKPHEKNCACYCKTEGEIEPVAGWIQDRLKQIQEGKTHSNGAPNKVAFRLESFTFTHSSIFTGISANGKGK